jgi:predicted metal-dependent peptidase
MKIEKAIYKAIESYPYYATGFLAMIPIEKKIYLPNSDVLTLCVDQYWRLYYSNEALELFGFHVDKILCQQLEHLLREHKKRIENRNHAIWNIACNCEINDDIEKLPRCFGKFRLYFPSSINCEDGKTAEYYYQNMKKTGKNNSVITSAVTSCPADFENVPPLNSDQGVLPEEQELLFDKIANNIEAYNKENRGSVPSHVLMWSQAKLAGRLPKIKWTRNISNNLKTISAGCSDYTFKKLSRRQTNKNRLILPATCSHSPTLAVVLDTSGSMFDLNDQLAGVLNDICRFKAKKTLIDCDCAIHQVRPLRQWRDLFKSKGGGGTDMRVGIEHAQKIKSDLILVLTDGETPLPAVISNNIKIIIISKDKIELLKK